MRFSFTKIILIFIGSIFTFLLLAILIGMWYVNTHFIVYKDDQYNFSIKYPKDWKIMVHPKANVAVVFLRPKDTSLDPMQESFNVTVQPLPKDIFTLDEFSDKIKAQMISVFGTGSNVHFIEYKPVLWGVHQGFRMSIEAPTPDNLEMVNAWGINHDQAYILTFLGNIDKYQHDFPNVEEMIRSFRLQ